MRLGLLSAFAVIAVCHGALDLTLTLLDLAWSGFPAAMLKSACRSPPHACRFPPVPFCAGRDLGSVLQLENAPGQRVFGWYNHGCRVAFEVSRCVTARRMGCLGPVRACR